MESGRAPEPSMLSSNRQEVREDLTYSKDDLLAIEEWVKVSSLAPQVLKLPLMML